MTTATDTDIAALVGAMGAVPCEHPSHKIQPEFHSDEPASHYAQARCDCGYLSHVTPICPGYVTTIANNLPLQCRLCGAVRPAAQATTILGPVNL